MGSDCPAHPFQLRHCAPQHARSELRRARLAPLRASRCIAAPHVCNRSAIRWQFGSPQFSRADCLKASGTPTPRPAHVGPACVPRGGGLS
jgi:hypothetical protein